MDTLASCYFCGVAVEEPLSEFALVPEGRRDPGGDPTNVTLCPGCTRKLETVLTEFEASLPSSDRPTGDPDPDPDPDRGESEETAGAGEPTDPDPEADVLFDPVEGSDLSIDDATGDAGSTAEDATEDDAADSSDTVTQGNVSETSTAEDPLSGSAPETGADADEPNASDESSEPGEAEAAEPTPADDTGTTPAEDTEPTPAKAPDGDEPNGDDEPSMTALEYNKVMRLIQNREFPVDRQEIVTVASSAYELSVEECETVLDVAVERGLLAESNGQLRRAD